MRGITSGRARHEPLRTVARSAVAVSLCLILLLPAFSTPAAGNETFVQLWQLQTSLARDVEALRVYMGGQKSRPLLLQAVNIQPHDLRSQALEFYRKAARLQFEHLRELAATLPRTTPATSFSESMVILESSRAMLQEVMDRYGLPVAEVSGDEMPAEVRPRNLYNDLRATGRQLDLLLDEQIGPADSYMSVLLAIGYASSLLAPYPQADRIPEEPDFVPGKAPADVWGRLLDCLNLVETLYLARGIESLRFEVRDDLAAEIRPVDANDLADLVAARLAFLVALDPSLQQPLEPVYPGRRFPSHVYQKTGVLKAQLGQLVQLRSGAGS